MHIYAYILNIYDLETYFVDRFLYEAKFIC